MNVEKIGPLPHEKGKQKVSEKSEPDSEAFKEMMKIGKSREVDLDEQGRRKLAIPHEEEEERPSTPDVYYYHDQDKEPSPYEGLEEGKEGEMKGKTSPESPEFYRQLSKKKLSTEKEKEMTRLLDKELKQAKESLPSLTEEEKEYAKALAAALEKKGIKIKKEELKRAKERALSEEAEKIKKAPLFAPKEKAEEIKVKEETKIKKAKTLEKEPKAKAVKEKAPPHKKEEAHLDIKKEAFPSPYQTLDLSPAVQSQAEILSAKIASNLNLEIVPLLEHMIGAMIQFTNKGISTTEIILNNAKFANSRFYNSRITFEKYATAPNSYNIKLTGSQEAVTIFNENIEGLYKNLKAADLDFEIGQLRAEYERPLFRRKAPPGEFDKEPKSR
jgi:hypothetical protein